MNRLMPFGIRPHRTLRRFVNDDSASVGVMMGASFALLISSCAVGVDFGLVYLAKRDLQNAADAAAVAAVDTLETGALATVQELIAKRGDEDIDIDLIEPGDYSRLASVALDQRFVADEDTPTAARVTLSREVPLYFGRIFMKSGTTTVRAQATAARLDRAALQVGARLGSLSGGLPNALLSALAGDDLQLTVDDFSDLEDTTIDVLDFADAVRDKVGMSGETFGEVFDSAIPLSDVVEAMAGASPDDDTKTLLMGIAAKLGGDAVKLADMIDLGPYAQTDFDDGTGHIEVDAASLLRGAIQYSHGDGYDVVANVSVAGASNTKVRLIGGNVVATSPLFTVTDNNDVVVRTGRIRMYLETTVPASVAGIASVKLPLYTELASAEAKLSNISCDGTAGTEGVTLAVTPSIGTVALASADADELGDLTEEPTLNFATLANVIGVTVQGRSVISLGGTTAKSVFFSSDEIAAQTTKSVSTDDAVTAIATSLAEDVTLQVEAGALMLTPTSLIKEQIAAALVTVAPALDAVINDTTRLMGMRLGIADTRVNAMKCGLPSLVA